MNLIFSIIYHFVFFLLACFVYAKRSCSKCPSSRLLFGKTAIVTGGNSGIGYEVCLNLAARGCRIIIADKDDATNSVKKIKKITGNAFIKYKYLNLASFRSIRKFANDFLDTKEGLNILINNAGNFNINLEYTEDGLQECMQVNYFGPFLLTHLLLDALRKRAPSRVIFVSSLVAFGADLTLENLNVPKDYYNKWGISTGIYGNSKLAQLCAASIFALRLKYFNITCNCAHPGFAKTNIFTNNDSLRAKIYKIFCYIWGKTAEEAAQTIIYLAAAKELRYCTGRFFMECQTLFTPSKVKNRPFCLALWKETEKLVKLENHEKL